MSDPIIPDVDEQGQVISRLDSAQQFAAQRSPDDAADTVNYAKKAGLDFATAESVKQKAPLPKAEGWGALVKDHPVLAQHLSEPAFASMAQDDTHTLSAFERLFGGWDEMAWRSKMAMQDDARSQELAAIGRAQRYGTATKEQLARGEDLEKESAEQKPEIGFVPGIVPAVVGMVPGLKRAANTAAAYALGGFGAGALAGGVATAPVGGAGAIPGAISGAVTMGGAGFVVGMAQDTASTEQGLAYREFVKMPGATPESAAVASDIVALANGGLQAIPAEKVLNLVPGLKGLIAGKATRDVMRSILGSNTGRAAMARFAGRVAESGLLMALIGGGQELVRETGAIAATSNGVMPSEMGGTLADWNPDLGPASGGGSTQTYHPDRIGSAMLSGAQQGLGFGLLHAVAPGISDYREAQIGQARGEMYKAIGQLSANSKLRERMPEAFKGYANEVISKYGKVNEVKAPAEQLAALFQKEGIDETKIQETMPEVAKQLREAGPKDEVIIPMADLATNIAPLKSFPELANDLRVGDELTPREAKKVQAEVDQMMKDAEKAKDAPEPEQAAPERRVYDDVFKKLTDAGQDPGVAQHDAALWAAFSKARGERTGIDPFDYYNKRALSIGAEMGDISLGQREKRLIVQHNLSSDNLLHVDESLGGFLPAPSIGIARKEHPLSGFGEISLLAKPELIDPSKGVPVKDADIYSPRHPRPRYKVEGKALRKLVEELKPSKDATGGYTSDLTERINEYGAEAALRDRDVRKVFEHAFLKEKGINVENKTRDVPLFNGDIAKTKAMKEFFETHGKQQNHEYGGEYHKGLSDAVRTALDEVAQKLDKEDRETYLETYRDAYFNEENGLLNFNRSHKFVEDSEKLGKTEPDAYSMEDAVREKVEKFGRGEFEKWAREKIKAAVGEPYLRKFSEMSGNEIRRAYTVDNILREMTKKLSRGESNFYGFGWARAEGAKRFRTLEAIQKADEKIIPPEDFAKIKDALNDEGASIGSKLGEYHGNGNSFGTLDAFVEALAESYRKGKSLRTELELSGFKDVPTELLSEIRDFADKLKNAPTEYFEAKPQRAVHLSEFQAAVIPKEASKGVRDILAKHGLKIYEYAKESESGGKTPTLDAWWNAQSESRAAKIADAAERENILFQPAYHGSPYQFSKFTLDHIGSGEGAQMYGWGLYFAEAKDVAEFYKNKLGDVKVTVDGEDAGTRIKSPEDLFNFNGKPKDAEKIVQGRIRALAEAKFALGYSKTDQISPKVLVEDVQTSILSGLNTSLRNLETLEAEAKEPAPTGSQISIFEREEYAKKKIESEKRVKKSLEDQLRYVDELAKNPERVNIEHKGKLYEVELPEKEDLLDHDLPLKKQSESVIKKLRDSGILPEYEVFKFKDGSIVVTAKATAMTEEHEVYSFPKDSKGLAATNPEEYVRRLHEKDLDKTGEALYQELSGELGSPREASLALNNAGIPGLKFLDQSSRGVPGKKTHNFVIWNEDAISALNVLEQRGGAAGTEGYRGKISFDQARSFFRITLTGKANLSTFLHESGHAFLEFMRMDAEGGHAQSKEDLAKAFEWMGVKPGEAPNTEQLEAFARGFEAYLLEGKAPAPGLRGMFHDFAGWLKLVYRSVAGLGVKLNDDIRGVMDRMLASDKEIEQARQGLGLEPMKKPEGMTDAEYAKYTERFGKAMQVGRDALEAQALREFGQMLGAHRDAVRGEVEDATKLNPVHNAYEALRTGKRLDGGEIAEEVRGKKLDREAVREAGYKGVKWSSITSEGGLDPEIAAPYYGFKDGPEMLSKLEARQSRTREIKEETDRRMMEMYPNADIAKMSAEAVKALHLDDVGNVLWLEAQAVGKRIGAEDPRTAKAVLKEVAKRRTEGMTALEMQPGRFARAEERSSMEWAEALKKKDFEGAHKAKLEQILNHEMWKQVADAKEEVDSIRNYLAKFEELPTRRRIGKAGQMYLEAIDKITDDIELKRTSGKEIGRRAALESYLKKMEDEDGATITIPEELRSEASLKNYKQMTLEELRAVNDAVRNIESMARLKNKIFDGREHRNFHETAVRAAEEVRANLGTPYAEKPGAPQNPGWFDKKKAMLRESRAEKKMIEFVAREFDGGKTAGKLHELIFQPFATADEKAHNLKEKIVETLLKPLRELTLKERLALDKTVDFLGTPMKMRDVIAVALNMGNDGNKRKLIDGYGYRGWSEEKIVNRLGELLTDKHLDLIEHFWKTIGSLWPEIKGLSERTTGLAPPKVESSKLTIRGREMEGGYYPIVYDRERSYKAEQIAQRKGDLFENNFLKPGVSKGFTEARTQFAAPLLLSLNVIPAHINEVVHYLTHYEPVRAVDRLLAHSELRTAITEGAGREVYNLFRPWLQRIAHEGALGMEHLTGVDKVLRNLRVGNTLNRFGFKITAALMQSFNLLSAMKELGGTVDGTKFMALGMKRWMTDLESFRDPFGPVYDASPEIRGKSVRIERELLQNFDHFTSAFSEFGHLKEQLGHFSMSFFTLVLRSADALTWYAAREKAFAENHPRPEEYADSVVRLSQMGEGVKDKAAIMFGGEGTKLFTGMYSWYSVVYNQLTEKQPQNRTTAKKIAENASRWWWMVIAPTVMMGVVKGKGPKSNKDDPMEIAKFYGEELLMEATKPWPLLGAATETVLTEHDARWGTWITTAIKGIRARAKLVKGEPLSEREKTDMVRSTGILGRLPADALWNAYKYVSAVQDGKLEEPIQDLLFRSPGEWK